MVSYIARRLLTVFLPTLLGVSLLVFGAMRLIPGNFVDIMLGLGADVSEEQRAAIARSYGLDQPLPIQYAIWLGTPCGATLGNRCAPGSRWRG